jgi:hypothetical protein
MRAILTRERGAIAVVASIVLLVVGAFMALALNVGLMMNTRGQLQNASDSAALAAAGSLDGTQAGLDGARLMAEAYAKAHRVTGEEVKITPDPGVDDVEFGRWHFKAEGGWAERFFEPLDDSQSLLIDAVRVRDGRDATGNHNNPLAVFFGAWLGRETVNVGSHAVAVSKGARNTDCPLPFILPSCSLQDGSGFKCDQDITLIMKPDGDDNVGFVFMLDENGNGNPQIYDNIINRCTVDATAGEYDVQNGNDMNDTVIQGLLGVSVKGNEITPIPPLRDVTSGPSTLCVFNPGYTSFPIGNTTCPDPKFSGDLTIAQYAEVEIKSVTDNNGNIYDQTSCPTATVKWQDYQATLKHDPTPGRKVVVNVKCGVGNGLAYNSGIVLRLVE